MTEQELKQAMDAAYSKHMAASAAREAANIAADFAYDEWVLAARAYYDASRRHTADPTTAGK